MINQSEHSRRALPTQRSAWALAFGACRGVRITLTPSPASTSSKANGNVLSLHRSGTSLANLVLGVPGQVSRLLADPLLVRVARAARRPRGEQVAFESPTTTLAPAIYWDHPTISQTPRSPRMMCSASKMPGLKGVLASEARPAGTDVSRPEAAVGPN
jgi:hypothetical protein